MKPFVLVLVAVELVKGHPLDAKRLSAALQNHQMKIGLSMVNDFMKERHTPESNPGREFATRISRKAISRENYLKNASMYTSVPPRKVEAPSEVITQEMATAKSVEAHALLQQMLLVDNLMNNFGVLTEDSIRLLVATPEVAIMLNQIFSIMGTSGEPDVTDAGERNQTINTLYTDAVMQSQMGEYADLLSLLNQKPRNDLLTRLQS